LEREREREGGREKGKRRRAASPQKKKKTRNNFCRLFDSISKQEMINAYSIENEINQINAPSHCKTEIGKLLILRFNSLDIDRFIVPHLFESTSRIPYEVNYKDTRQRPIPRNHDERLRRKPTSRNKDKTKTNITKRNTKQRQIDQGTPTQNKKALKQEDRQKREAAQNVFFLIWSD
jgi:hypothetical protein